MSPIIKYCKTKTVVSLDIITEYEYPAEQCSYLLRYYASTIYASTNRVRDIFGAETVRHVGRPKDCYLCIPEYFCVLLG